MVGSCGIQSIEAEKIRKERLYIESEYCRSKDATATAARFGSSVDA
jgi:hypothetical protein